MRLIDTADDVSTTIAALGVLPVLTVGNARQAHALAAGLVEGGLPIAEVTLRTEFALDAVRILSADEDVLVGAGTVLSVDDAARAVDRGARFIVSPGLSPDVVKWCQENGIRVIPGVATPTEALAARELGIRTAKFFPASVFGGPAWLKAIAAPVPDMRFIATGGVNDATLPDYLHQGNLDAVGGSWFLPSDVDAGAEQIATTVSAVVARVREIRSQSRTSTHG